MGPAVAHHSWRGLQHNNNNSNSKYDNNNNNNNNYNDNNNNISSSKSGVLVAIDFEKAFDSLSGGFLYEVLNKIKFGPYSLQWIKTL